MTRCLNSLASVYRTIRFEPNTIAAWNYAGGEKIDQFSFPQDALLIGFQVLFHRQGTGIPSGAGGEMWNALIKIDSNIPTPSQAYLPPFTAPSYRFPTFETVGFSNVEFSKFVSNQPRRSNYAANLQFFPKDQCKKVLSNQQASLYAQVDQTNGVCRFYVHWSLYWIPLT